MQSEATTPKQYIDGLPKDRQAPIRKLRALIRKNLPKGIVEEMRWGMICYEVPLRIEPDTYNGKPLMYAALASQKNHMAIYLTGVYGDPQLKTEFLDAWNAHGGRVDMGKSCIRFKAIDDLPLDAVGDAIAAFDVDEFVALVERARAR